MKRTGVRINLTVPTPHLLRPVHRVVRGEAGLGDAVEAPLTAREHRLFPHHHLPHAVGAVRDGGPGREDHQD